MKLEAIGCSLDEGKTICLVGARRSLHRWVMGHPGTSVYVGMCWTRKNRKMIPLLLLIRLLFMVLLEMTPPISILRAPKSLGDELQSFDGPSLASCNCDQKLTKNFAKKT